MALFREAAAVNKLHNRRLAEPDAASRIFEKRRSKRRRRLRPCADKVTTPVVRRMSKRPPIVAAFGALSRQRT
jgi:hypothetical protein